MRKLTGILVISVFAILLSLGSVWAQDPRQNEPGKFDFYLLALSWSPSYCEASHERAPDRAPDQQCGARPFSFVVHGLWPQYEAGFPEFCQVPAPRLDRGAVSSMLDLMPSPRLVFHEWDRHGTCSGLSARAYFETVRKARAVVKIPPEFLQVEKPLSLSPDQVEEAFVKANAGLSRAAISVSCDGKQRLSEVRLCLGKDLQFRDCPDADRRACRREQVVMPAVRGG
ncbi:MAG: ribonuclease T2 family protein [Xanthobacteraceae bacterium]